MKKVLSYLKLIQKIKENLKLFPNYELKKYATLNEINHPYKAYKIQPKKLNPKMPLLIITTGFHGEEPQGPLTISKNIYQIIQDAKQHKIQLIIYPCINPSGWEHNKRYNLSNENPNNSFFAYKLKDNTISSELPIKTKFKSIQYFKNLPKESKSLLKDILKYKPTAILDIHQDDEMPKNGNSYIFLLGPKEQIIHIQKKINKITAIAKKSKIPMQEPLQNIPKNLKGKIAKSYITDENAILQIHDTSITDLAFRKGAKFAITLETSQNLPPKIIDKINFTYIKELINLISR